MKKEKIMTFRLSAKDKEDFLRKLSEYDLNMNVSDVLQIMVRNFNKEGFKSLSK